MKRLLLIALMLASLSVLQAADDRPIVGAIRWDAWYGDGSVTKAVESSLGQPRATPWVTRPTQPSPERATHLVRRLSACGTAQAGPTADSPDLLAIIKQACRV